MKMFRLALLSVLLGLAAGIHAQEPAAPDSGSDEPAAPVEDIAAPPPIPPKITGEEVEPSVVIRRQEDKLVEEYSINGRVYMVKVTPDKGLPYYYLDEDGDGMLELQPGDDALNPVRPAYWKVKEWK
ncbi:MAG: DUF2782 domain-containing protein [Xanthomonadales bacterium]|nr:DUF2782 domain-containing protein [Gammaproteobacteria bacterium]NNL95557.1 DUF2782 domain-containing protein [Xanthomonadales bacterium]